MRRRVQCIKCRECGNGGELSLAAMKRVSLAGARDTTRNSFPISVAIDCTDLCEESLASQQALCSRRADFCSRKHFPPSICLVRASVSKGAALNFFSLAFCLRKRLRKRLV